MLSVALIAMVAYALATSGSVTAAEPNGDRQFIVVCSFDRSATLDPIVKPGVPGFGHQHDFFGAVGVDENTTNASLQGMSTTCGHPGDKAAYWAPSLKVNGVWHRPDHLKAYYIRPANVEVPTAFSSGFRQIAGDAGATTRQSTNYTYWRCKRPDHTHFSAPLTSGPIDCPDYPDKQLLVLTVNFAPCWNGQDDSPDHKSHVALPLREQTAPYADIGCPISHQIRLPTLSVHIHYRTGGGPSAELSSSASIWSGHGDFMNGWDPQALEDKIQQCFVNDVCSNHYPYAFYGTTPIDENVDGRDDYTNEVLDVNLSEPTIVSGPTVGNLPAKVGRTLTASATPAGNPTPTITYRWHRCLTTGLSACSPVGTGPSYTVAPTDYRMAGSWLRVTAVATSRTGSTADQPSWSAAHQVTL